MATHSSVLARRIPGTGEPGGLPSMGSYRVGHDWSDLVVAAGIKLFSFPMKPWKNSCLFAFIDAVQNANVNSILLLCVCDLFFLSEVPLIFFSCDTLKFHYSAPGVVQLLSHVWLLATPWLYPPGSSAHGTSQARVPEWVALSFSRRFSQPRNQTRISCIAGGFFTTEPSGEPKKWVFLDLSYLPL